MATISSFAGQPGAAMKRDPNITRSLDLSMGLSEGLRDTTTTPAPRACQFWKHWAESKAVSTETDEWCLNPPNHETGDYEATGLFTMSWFVQKLCA
ncbi:hypothetical protein COOONC_14485 [Cooperia oncophora]